VVPLVEDHRVDLGHVQGPPSDVIEGPSGSAHDDGTSLTQVVRLGFHAHAAYERGGADAEITAEPLGFPGDLEGEFPGGRKNEHPGAPLSLSHVVKEGQYEREGLSRSRLGLNDQVAAAVFEAQHFRLNRRGFRETSSVKGSEQFGSQAETAPVLRGAFHGVLHFRLLRAVHRLSVFLPAAFAAQKMAPSAGRKQSEPSGGQIRIWEQPFCQTLLESRSIIPLFRLLSRYPWRNCSRKCSTVFSGGESVRRRKRTEVCL